MSNVDINYYDLFDINMSNLPKQRHQANARERYRTHSVNSAFSTLRNLIPTEPKNRKLSKIETLRLATSYIEHLGAILLTGNTVQPCLHIFRSENSIRHRSNICTFCIKGNQQKKIKF